MSRVGKVLLGLLVILIILAAGGVWYVRRAWPQVTGTLSVAGLSAPVRVVRDKWGVPQIYAQNDHDLFMAQGYVHAQDRLWQMEFSRRIGNGTLSAVIGKATVATDQFARTIGWRRSSEQEWKDIDDNSRAILTAYSDGVNAFIQSHKGNLPLEFTILRFSPEPWTPIDTLVWGNVVTYSLAGNSRLEMLRSQIIAVAGPDVATKMLPPYGADRPIVVPPEANGYAWLHDAHFTGYDALDALLGEPGSSWGSNDWVISGSRTATGKPFLANDVHLAVSMPSIWYQIGLHGGNYDVVGFSFPGVPLTIVGHNNRIAWGSSNQNPDVEDFYMEKLNDPTNPTQYQFKGAWQDLKVIKETVKVKNNPDVTVNVLLTQHGPIMNDVIGDLQKSEPMSMRWTANEDNRLFQSIVMINRASNWDEFRTAASYWDVPSQNFVYADVDGNIGYQATGRIPIRPTNDQGLVPMPGWTGENEWQGYIPFDKLPYSFNPPVGFLATANNKVVSDDYPYHLSYEWDPGFRAKRITDMLKANDHVSLDDIKAMQADTYSLPAEGLRPYLLAVKPENDREQRALDQVKAWDMRYETDRVGASIYQQWYWYLVRNIMNDELNKDLVDKYLAGQYERHGAFQVPLVTNLMANPSDPWFDDHTTPQVETRDQIAHKSLVDALDALSKKYGDDMSQWNWGRLHTVTFVEQPLGQSGIAPLERIFNVGPFPARGDNFTVDGSSFAFNAPFEMIHGASQRQIVDLSNFANSVSILGTGQSGLPFNPHRSDMIAMWQNVEYFPMLFDSKSVDANADAVLTLTP
jgi:penicillin amidase